MEYALMAAESSEGGAARRAAILESAMRVFLRYGFKKTSMDDLARAASISRQGLYMYYRTKEDLFKAVVSAQSASMRAARKAALADDGQSVEARIVAAFAATHGSLVGQLGHGYMSELMDTATTLVGPTASELDKELNTEVVRLLRSSGVAEAWKEHGLSAKDIGDSLLTTSFGAKEHVETLDEYIEKMRIAVRMICSRG